MSYHFITGDCLIELPKMGAHSVDLIFGSPPYMDARTYGIDATRDCQQWVDWMLQVTEAAVRVSRGLVLWVVSGVQRELCYWPGCEGLAWEWWQRGNHLWRPCVWWKVDCNDGGTGIPGSGGKQWLRNDWEYVLAFKRPGWLPWADPLVMGHEPVTDQVGGEMSNRLVNGARVNDDPWKTLTRGGAGIGGRTQDGVKKRGRKKRQRDWGTGYTKDVNGQKKVKQPGARVMDITAGHDLEGNLLPNGSRPMPKIANPGNCIIVKARVGGGHMGDKACHESEAPFPEDLAEFFVRSYCPPGGTVLDPFSGSGTTVATAHRFGRCGIGIDLRPDQNEIALARCGRMTQEMFA